MPGARGGRCGCLDDMVSGCPICGCSDCECSICGCNGCDDVVGSFGCISAGCTCRCFQALKGVFGLVATGLSSGGVFVNRCIDPGIDAASPRLWDPKGIIAIGGG